MSQINEHVGSRIRKYRKSKGLTLQQLADQIHKSRASVSKYETGEIALDIETLFEIADVLQVSPVQLMDYRPPMPTPVPGYSGHFGFHRPRSAYSAPLFSASHAANSYVSSHAGLQTQGEPAHSGSGQLNGPEDLEHMEISEPSDEADEFSGMSPFFRARRLYFYFYDGRYQRLKDGVIDIQEDETVPGTFRAALSISAVTSNGRSSQVYYTGKVLYSDMLIRFSFVNQCNALEEDLLYIFNPLDIRDSTDGLLCGISSADLKPCAFKCLVTLTPKEHTESFKKQLLISKNEMKRWQKLNMLIVDNREV